MHGVRRWLAVGTLVLTGCLAGCGSDESSGEETPPPVVEAPGAGAPDAGPPDAGPPDAGPPPDAGQGRLGFLRQYDEPGRERTSGSAAGPDGSFVVLGAIVREFPAGEPGVVRAQYNALLDHYDPQGNLLWNLELPEGVRPARIVVEQERILVAGNYSGAPQLAGTTLPKTIPGRGLFLLTLTRQGTPVSAQGWVIEVGRARPFDTEVEVNHLHTDASGNVVMVGQYRGALDLGDGELPQEDPRIRRDATFVARFTPQGQLLWSRSLGTDVPVLAAAVGGTSGVIALGGVALENADIGEGSWGNTDEAPFVLGLDASTGEERWRHVLDGVDGWVLDAVETAAGFTFMGTYGRGRFSFAGTAFTPPTGDEDLMLLRVDAGGQPVWARQYDGGVDMQMLQLVTDAEGHLTLSMSAFGPVALGGERLPPAAAEAGAQIYVAAYDGEGRHVWSRELPHLGATGRFAGHGLLAQPGGNVVLVTSLAAPGTLDGRPLTPVADEDVLIYQLLR